MYFITTWQMWPKKRHFVFIDFQIHYTTPPKQSPKVCILFLASRHWYFAYKTHLIIRWAPKSFWRCLEMKQSNYRLFTNPSSRVLVIIPSQSRWKTMTAPSLLPWKNPKGIQYYPPLPLSTYKLAWTNVSSLPGVVDKKMWPKWIMYCKCQNKFQLKMIFLKEI